MVCWINRKVFLSEDEKVITVNVMTHKDNRNCIYNEKLVRRGEVLSEFWVSWKLESRACYNESWKEGKAIWISRSLCSSGVSGYGQRWASEGVFSAVKRYFGETVRVTSVEGMIFRGEKEVHVLQYAPKHVSGTENNVKILSSLS